MKQIPLSQGQFALVDDEDYSFLNQRKWHFLKSKSGGGYAVHLIRVDGRQHAILMHRLILLAPNNKVEIDHIDRNKLNNQKINLRYTNDRGTSRNIGLRSNNKSGYKGVYYHNGKKKWTAAIRGNGKQIWLGDYETAEDAAKAYNKAARKYHGQFAWLNPIPNKKAQQLQALRSS